MEKNRHKLGWIGVGRMGLPMAARLVKTGHDLHVWNRTAAKAEPLAAAGATIVGKPADLAGVDILFTMVATGADLEAVCFGEQGVFDGGSGPGIVVDCSSIGADQSKELRGRFEALGSEFLAAPVSGNGKCVEAGKLSCVVSGPEQAFETVRPYLETIAGNGAVYVGEGELARTCKIAHNVLLAVYFQSLVEVVLLAEKAGVPRHAFLGFINNSVMGSIFSRYKSNALVNLDWTTTFTPALLRKDIDLGLQHGRTLGVPMPATVAVREALQTHFGLAQLKPDPKSYLEQDFAALLETGALAAGMALQPENKPVPSGLEPSQRAASDV